MLLGYPTSAFQNRDDDRSDYRHRQIIGYIGLVLPILLIALALVRDGVEAWKGLDSVSAYYYTGAVVLFVGMLVALAFFLALYEGYGNDYYAADRTVAVVAAIAALGVAFFPTYAPPGYVTPHWWRPWVGWIHFGSAFTLFGMFAVFSLWLFRKSSPSKSNERGGAPAPSDSGNGFQKTWRNRVYLLCGVAIIGCMIIAAVKVSSKEPIFWAESGALFAFSISWLTKGRALRSILATLRPAK